ncbi:hypothetical protein WG66_010912 [Moniliophthora roreri]|nr:hypothetical protein WG66_010912 [Moniliophthora roreri]
MHRSLACPDQAFGSIGIGSKEFAAIGTYVHYGANVAISLAHHFSQNHIISKSHLIPLSLASNPFLRSPTNVLSPIPVPPSTTAHTTLDPTLITETRQTCTASPAGAVSVSLMGKEACDFPVT